MSLAPPTQLLYLGDRHAILSALRDLIDAAEHSILLQMYLFAASGDQTLLLPRPDSFPYAETVAQWLVAKKQRHKNVSIVVILDSNTPENPELTRSGQVRIRTLLAQSGIVVLCASLFGNHFDRRRRLHPAMNLHLHSPSVSASDWVEVQNRWQALHNVEDHRKNLIIDGGRAAIITSHNLFDPAFDWYENLFWLTGDVAQRLWRSALVALAESLKLPSSLPFSERQQLLRTFSDQSVTAAAAKREPLVPTMQPIPSYPLPLSGRAPSHPKLVEDPDCTLLESAAIRSQLVALFAESQPQEEVIVATAYFSDLEMFSCIEAAVLRGVRVRILIDSLHALLLPPLSAWLTRNLVNHQVMLRAQKLKLRVPDSFSLRIHDSRAGAMMHAKTAARLGPRGLLIGGQANFTPNSFSGAYLETDILTRAPSVIAAFAQHFEQLWQLPSCAESLQQRGLWAWLQLWLCSLLLWLFARVGLRP